MSVLFILVNLLTTTIKFVLINTNYRSFYRTKGYIYKWLLVCHWEQMIIPFLLSPVFISKHHISEPTLMFSYVRTWYYVLNSFVSLILMSCWRYYDLIVKLFRQCWVGFFFLFSCFVCLFLFLFFVFCLLFLFLYFLFILFYFILSQWFITLCLWLYCRIGSTKLLYPCHFYRSACIKSAK